MCLFILELTCNYNYCHATFTYFMESQVQNLNVYNVIELDLNGRKKEFYNVLSTAKRKITVKTTSRKSVSNATLFLVWIWLRKNNYNVRALSLCKGGVYPTHVQIFLEGRFKNNIDICNFLLAGKFVNFFYSFSRWEFEAHQQGGSHHTHIFN